MKYKVMAAVDISAGNTNSNTLSFSHATERTAWTVNTVITDANTSITAAVIKLQRSPDGGTTWFDMASHTMTAAEITALAASFDVVDKHADYVRGRIEPTGAGANDTVDMWIEGPSV